MNRATAIALAAVLTLGGVACDQTKTRPIEPTALVDDCSRCHGYPPPAFIAGGTTHTTSTQCSACHPDTVEADNVTIVPGGLHMNGVVDVGSGAGHALPYVAEHPTAALANIASCTACHGADYGGGTVNVSCNACHATDVAGSSPDWKTNCTFCHGTRTANVTTATPLSAPPQAVAGATAPTDPTVGAHQAHLVQGSVSNALPCASCHAVPSQGQALTHFTGNGAPGAITFSTLATKGVTGAAYTGGTCTVYCHGSGTEFPGNAAGAASPSWTSAGVTCTTCHGNPPASGPSVSGQPAHAFHVTNMSVACTTCHPAPPGQLASHVNGTKDVVVQPPAGGPVTITGWDCATCHAALGIAAAHPLPFLADHTSAALSSIGSCTSCHGADYGGGSAQSCNACHATSVAASAPDWKTNCTFCHGTRTANVTTATPLSAPPQAVAGATATTDPKVGAHQAHLSAGAFAGALPCSSCHTPPTGAQALTHFGGGTATITFSALAAQGVSSPAYAGGGGSCAVYCHGATLIGGPAASPAWTSTASLACGSCHGNPPSSHSAGSTDCNSCHPGTVNANGTINVAGGLHVNGVKEASSAHAADWGLPSQHGYYVNANGLASCKSCHGSTLGGGSGRACADCHGAGWDTNCTFCHGNPGTGRASPPVDTQGRTVTSNVSVGAHASHVGTTIATPFACGECHPARSSSVITDAAHIDGNGIAEVSLGALARTGGAAATYTRASATSASCSSVYCHGQFTGGSGWDPSWTSTTQATCTSCHGAPPNTGEHQRHSGGSFTCSECHGTGYSTSTVNAATHVNGTKNVPFSSSVTSPVPPPVFNGNCTLTCHSKNHSNEPW